MAHVFVSLGADVWLHRLWDSAVAAPFSPLAVGYHFPCSPGNEVCRSTLIHSVNVSGLGLATYINCLN